MFQIHFFNNEKKNNNIHDKFNQTNFDLSVLTNLQ